jgi:hypothetical protein
MGITHLISGGGVACGRNPVDREKKERFFPVRGQFLFLTLGIIGAALWGASPTLAQSSRDPNFVLTPEIIGKIAARLRLEPDSRHLRAIIEAQYRGPQGIEEREREIDEEAATVRPIVLHLRSTQGVPFPKPEEIPPVLHITKEQEQEIIDLHMQGVERIKEMHQSVPDLPKCSENKTTREETGMKDAKGDKTILFDMLFIAKRDLPLDTDEVFGKDTIIHPYDAETPNALAFSAVGVGVTCLPTRMRATKAYVYRDEGANALKNFDENPHGKGKVHPKMEALINQTFR